MLLTARWMTKLVKWSLVVRMGNINTLVDTNFLCILLRFLSWDYSKISRPFQKLHFSFIAHESSVNCDSVDPISNSPCGTISLLRGPSDKMLNPGLSTASLLHYGYVIIFRLNEKYCKEPTKWYFEQRAKALLCVSHPSLLDLYWLFLSTTCVELDLGETCA